MAPHAHIQKDTCTITMTTRDAEILVRLLCRVGGSPDGHRGTMDRILYALQDAGIQDPGIHAIPIAGAVDFQH